TVVSTASSNEAGPTQQPAYGSVVRVAPPAARKTPAATVAPPVADLLRSQVATGPTGATPLWLIFPPDGADPDLWYDVGYTTRSAAAEAGFFSSATRIAPDEFAPAALVHEAKSER